MVGPLLEGKFHVPPRRRALVTRPRLIARLQAGDRAPLTLVSAPAGFGKTTLLTGWLAHSDVEAAWVSLDARDNDPAVFWTYVLTALGEPGTAALELLQATPAPIEPVLTTLLNELAGQEDERALVLDDYHAVESLEVHEGVAFLLEHLPPQLRLVLATRADPPLPLARLRARGQLVELRAADLRFSEDEAAAYLNDSMGLALTEDDVGTLEARTEGWIAALQLAALSMQGRDDASTFIADFAGDDRFVVDYLAGEVLARQPEDVRRFLLETSVLHRLTGSLADAVTGGEGGQATLEALERANLFLVPLDGRRRWYRYHHLFAEVLRANLLDEAPERIAELHQRASAWFEQDGDLAEAIRHAMAGGHVERAADLVERAVPELSRARQDATLRGHLEALPDEVYERRPVLSVALVGARMVHGDVEGVEAHLDRAERLLDDPAAVVVDEHEHARLPSQIAMYRTGLAHLAGDLPSVLDNAERLLDAVDADDHLGRGAAQAFLALASWGLGDLAAAEAWEVESIANMVRAGRVSDALGCSLALGDIQVARGHLSAARQTYEGGLARAARSGEPGVRGTADLHVGLAELDVEADDLAGARAHLDASRDLGEPAALAQQPYRWRVAMARVLAAEGDRDGAVALLDEAEPLVNTDYSPAVRPVASVRSRVHLDQGDVAAARRWADQRGLSADDELTYLREHEHLTLARLLLAEGSVDEATALLERLLAAAEAGGRAGSAEEAGALLGRREGGSAEPLVDPLSERELEVLRLLESDLSGPEIAAELIVSLNTLRTHTRHIFEKLGVNSRRAAVRRATELGL